MLKFQSPVLNDDVYRVATNKHLYNRVKTEKHFLPLIFFIGHLCFIDTFGSKKVVSINTAMLLFDMSYVMSPNNTCYVNLKNIIYQHS